MSKVEAKKIIKKYAKVLEQNKYLFDSIYLFGSVVREQAGKNSDIDIAVVSNKLKRNWNENEDLLWQYTMEVDSRLEPHGYSIRDFQDSYDPLIKEIKRTGIKIV